ncbi:MAG: NAD-dependent epimerase/dehydratase family protein, partial [Gammaproteobacteria bacterium]|nr:NAD-dependent epimerase/dehydratase family protein [Gammaproteobacteria bacterium]
IYGSTSSVYGKEATGPEDSNLQPFSPYGLTKLASEHLCRAYEANFGLPVTVLRYFSVYGPRQRPDMAYHILMRGLLKGGETFPMFGDGEQTRSNTFVNDCVEGTILAFEKQGKVLGETMNLGGGEIISLKRAIEILEDIFGKKANIEHHPARPGDQKHTAANIDKARELLDYNPITGVEDGLKAEAEWIKTTYS